MEKTSKMDNMDERYPSGRRKEPLGTRQGGLVWTQLHEHLAETALEVMAEIGFGEMTTEGVADKAGVAKRTAFRHYPNKLDLGIAAIRRLPTYEGADVGSGSIKEQVRKFLESTYTWEARFPQVLATAIVHRNTDPELMAALKEHVIIPREAVFAAHIKRGQEAGEIDPEIKAAAVAALSIGMQMDHFTGMHPWPSNEQGTEYAMSIIWPMIRAK